MKEHAREPISSPAVRHSGRLALWIVALAAASVHAWTLGLGLKQDDYSVIKSSGEWLARMFENDFAANGSGTSLSALFRPVLWSMLVVERFLAGVPTQPILFHAGSMAVHMAAAVMTAMLARCVIGSRGALVAGLVVAVGGAGAEAVGWIAARGDLLVSFLGTMSAYFALRDKSVRSAFLAGAATALAMGSKESGYISAPISLALLFVIDPRGAPRRALPFLVPLAVMLLLRFVQGGTILPHYLEAPEILAARFRHSIRDPQRLFSSIAYVVMPSTSILGGGGVLSTLLISSICAFLALPLVLSARESWLRWTACVVALVLTIVPTFALSPDTALLSGTRFYHNALIPLGLLVGLAWSSADRWVSVRAPAIGRLVPSLLAMATLVPSVVCVLEYANDERAVHSKVESRLESIERFAKDSPSDTLFLLVDRESTHAGRFLLSADVTTALAPPFRTERRDAMFFRTLEQLFFDPSCFESSRPLRVLSCEDDRYVAKSSLIPASLPTPPPQPRSMEKDRLDDGVVAAWTVDPAVAPLHVGALEFVFEPGAAKESRWKLSTDRAEKTWRFSLPDSAEPRRITVVPADDRDIAFSASITRLSMMTSKPRLLAGPRLLHDTPTLEIDPPTTNGVVKLDAPMRVGVRGLPAGASLSVTAIIGSVDSFATLRATVPADRVERLADGTAAADLLTLVTDPGSTMRVDWKDLKDLIPRHLAPVGIRILPARLRFRATMGPTRTTMAVSPWFDFLLSF